MSFATTWIKRLFQERRRRNRKAVSGRGRLTRRLMVEQLEDRCLPSSLAFSTYLGGTANDGRRAIAVDAAGNTYVAGLTESANFPVTPGAYRASFNGGISDGFVAKLDPSGALVWATYLGGSGDEQVQGIAVDGSGNVYVTGQTSSTDFPTTLGAFQTSYRGGGSDAFVTKLNATGSALVYSTYLGGSGWDGGGEAIAVDASGNAYVTGETRSSDLPTTAGAFQTTLHGFQSAFVTKLNPTGSALVYSTFLGGASGFIQDGFGIAVDTSGDAYVTGRTDATNFPTTPGAFQTINKTGGGFEAENAFVTELNPAGSGLVYSTYLGGSGWTQGGGIVLDGSGNAYVAGYTASPNFPTTPGAFQPALANHSGGYNAFVTKLNSGGTGLVYSTYLGGSGDDLVGVGGTPVALDSSGNAYVIGYTSSTDFPTANPVQAANAGGRYDAFVTKLNASGTGLIFSTYLGGSGDEAAVGSPSMALDSSGNVYVTGSTSSTNFPTANPFQAANAGGDDAFVAKIVTNLPPTANAGGPYVITEGSSLTLNASASSDPDGDALSYSWTINGQATAASGVSPTLTWSQLQALGIDDGPAAFNVKVRVDDGHGNVVVSPATTLTVNVVLPAASLSGPSNGVPGQPRTFTFSATDPSAADQAAGFTYQITWGDGSPLQTISRSPGNAAGVALDHIYTTPGAYTVQVTATEKDDGTSAPASQSLTLLTAEVQGTDLAVGGTTGNDNIFLYPTDTVGHIAVTVNGVAQGSFLPTGHILVYGQSGNDTILLLPNVIQGQYVQIGVPAVLFGGNGNDILSAFGSSANNVLVGGSGNNLLTGGTGRNILIAGSGTSTLVGGTGQDILIGGTTDFDHNLTALYALMAEWGRTDATYATRVSHLNGSLAGGLNGSFFLNPTTVHGNANADVLIGGLGPDWFFAAANDQLLFVFPWEVITKI